MFIICKFSPKRVQAFNLRNLMRARIHPICCINLRYRRVSRYIRFHTFSNGPQFTILSCSKPTHNGFSLVATLASDGSKGVLTGCPPRICFFFLKKTTKQQQQQHHHQQQQTNIKYDHNTSPYKIHIIFYYFFLKKKYLKYIFIGPT